MVSLSTGILILFAVSCLVAFIVPFATEGVLKQIGFDRIVPGLGAFALVALPFAALFGIAAGCGADVSAMVPGFAVASVVSFLLSRINLPAHLRGILLLAGCVLMTINTSVDAIATPVAAVLMGLLSWKIADNLCLPSESTLDDVLPSLFWLVGVMWIRLASPEAVLATQEGALLGIISVAQILRVVQAPFVGNDKLFVKRVVLAATGGLGVLIVLTKLLLAVNMTGLALLVGAGMFVTYLFFNIDAEARNTGSGATGMKLLIIAGMLLLVATRFFGTFGLVALAPTALIAPRTLMAQLPGLFFAVRALLQAFILTYNSNVTGINITHAYTGAALYAGFVGMIILTMLLREIKDRRILAAVFLGAGALVPVGANYLLHAEPTCSLLVSSTVAGVLLSALGPALQRGEASGYENLLLMPAFMVASGVMTGGLIEAGNTTTIQTKATMLAYGIAFVVVASVVFYLILKKTGPKPAQASSD